MADEQSTLDVRVEGANALSTLAALRRRTIEFAQSTIQSAADLRKAEAAVATFGRSIGNAERSIGRLSTTVKEQRALIKALTTSLNASYKERERLVGIISQHVGAEKAAKIAAEGSASSDKKATQAARERVQAEKDKARAIKSGIGATASAMQSSLGISATSGSSVNLNSQAAANARLAQNAASLTQRATEQSVQNMNAVRYALYDVSAVAERTGRVLVNVAVGSVRTAMDWERAYANVARTTGVVGDEAESLRNSLIGLTRDVPIAFGNITEIAALGGQLGIATDGIDEFTSVVSRLTATTNLTQDAAGTALGRFQAILGVTNDEFENLASAILKVGVNSVATETQIVRIATQLSSVGAYAGMSYDQIIGLSGALASVGAPPELSRGTFTRLFAQMNNAVTFGGTKLDEFARIAGVSADKFQSSWGNPAFGDVLLGFIKGLRAEGVDAERALRDLGITSVRDVPLLTRLGIASQVVAKSFADAASGARDGSTLNEQYGHILETLASKFQIFLNGLEELSATLGESSVGPVREFIEGLTGVVHGLTDLLRHPFWSIIGQKALLISLISGALLLAVASSARFVASILAITTALRPMTLQMTSVQAANGAMNVTMSQTPIVASAASRSLVALGAAMKALPWVALGVIVSQVLDGVMDGFKNWYDESQKWGDGLYGQINRLKGVADGQSNVQISYILDVLGKNPLEVIGQLGNTLGEAISSGDWGKALVDNFSAGGDAAKKARAEINKLFRSGNYKQASEAIVAYNAALGATGNSAEDVRDSYLLMLQTLSPVTAKTVETTIAAEEHESRMESLAGTLGMTADEFGELAASISSTAKELTAKDIYDKMTDEAKAWAEAQAEATSDTSDSWEDFATSMDWSLRQVTERLVQDTANIAAFQQNLVSLVAMGATDLAVALSEMDPATGARFAAEALTFTPDELASVNNSWSQAAQMNTQAYAESLLTNSYLIQQAFQKGGLDAVKELNNALVAGGPELQSVIDKWGLTVEADADTTEATNTMIEWREVQSASPVPIYTYIPSENLLSISRTISSLFGSVPISPSAYVGGWPNARGGLLDSAGRGHEAPRFANGGGYGVFRGPGTGTSDSIWARVSNGEFINKADSVRFWGAHVFDDLNRRQFPRAFYSLVGTGGSNGPQNVTNVEVNQINPVTRDPLKQLRQDSENLATGLWG